MDLQRGLTRMPSPTGSRRAGLRKGFRAMLAGAPTA